MICGFERLSFYDLDYKCERIPVVLVEGNELGARLNGIAKGVGFGVTYACFTALLSFLVWVFCSVYSSCLGVYCDFIHLSNLGSHLDFAFKGGLS